MNAKHLRQIAAAIEALDRIDPTWPERVDVETLDMMDSAYCIVGQAFGSPVGGYTEWLREHDLENTDADLALANFDRTWEALIPQLRGGV